ncbi:RidA family protein [Paenibacillus solisilvae]|uniref:RidA family protein n=1 Tax=Paenibacillus solisilvae TaxID=2486751 RepID=A0ABW0VUF7_9BACL
MSSIYQRLEELGLELPQSPPKGGIYAKAKRTGNLVFTSGQGPIVNGKPAATGKLGLEVTVEEGQQMARLAVLNCLSVLEEEIGDLRRITQVVKLLGFVASGPAFYRQPEVMNGASQLLVDLFGERGEHARSAIGTNNLPLNFPVEIEMIVEVV